MFRNRLYIAIISSHFVVDTLNSIGAILLAVLAKPMGLTNAQIGLALTVYFLIGSLGQPVFGLIADRFPVYLPLLAAIGVGWMALFYCIVAMTTDWIWMLPFFLLTAVGSCLFHPVGTTIAAKVVPQRAASATAIFFFCGQMGLASGPALGGILLGNIGRLGILPLALVALAPAALLLFVARRRLTTAGRAEYQQAPTILASTSHQQQTSVHNDTRPWLITMALIGAFITLIALRSSIQATYQAFLPKLFADRGWEPEIYGLLAGTFMGASAVGNIITGDIADRFGMRIATVLPLLFSVPAGLACLMVSSLPLTFVMCGLAGILVGGQHSVLVVHAQRLLPSRHSFASGLILGFTFATGAIGLWLAGLIADHYGLALTMQTITLLGVPTAALALTLPGRKHISSSILPNSVPSPVTSETLSQ